MQYFHLRGNDATGWSSGKDAASGVRDNNGTGTPRKGSDDADGGRERVARECIMHMPDDRSIETNRRGRYDEPCPNTIRMDKIGVQIMELATDAANRHCE